LFQILIPQLLFGYFFNSGDRIIISWDTAMSSKERLCGRGFYGARRPLRLPPLLAARYCKLFPPCSPKQKDRLAQAV
jgi:hypothetical protein